MPRAVVASQNRPTNTPRENAIAGFITVSLAASAVQFGPWSFHERPLSVDRFASRPTTGSELLAIWT